MTSPKLRRDTQRVPVAGQRSSSGGLSSNLSYRLAILNFLVGKATARIYSAENLTSHQWKVMSVLYSMGPRPASEIEPWVTLDKAAISRALQQLRKLGYIKRHLRDTDARTVDIALTENGRQAYARMAKQMSRLQSELLCELDTDAVNMLFTSFDRLEAKLRRHMKSSGAKPSRLVPAEP